MNNHEKKPKLPGDSLAHYRALNIKSGVVLAVGTIGGIGLMFLLPTWGVETIPTSIVAGILLVGGLVSSAVLGSMAAREKKQAEASAHGPEAEISSGSGQSSVIVVGKGFLWLVVLAMIINGVAKSDMIGASGALLPALIAILLPGKKKR